jgi:hypothetical protein
VGDGVGVADELPVGVGDAVGVAEPLGVGVGVAEHEPSVKAERRAWSDAKTDPDEMAEVA